MKSKEQKLLELLQPKDYKSKIKLYCRECVVEDKIIKVSLAQLKKD